MESPCACGIEPPGYIGNGFSIIIMNLILNFIVYTVQPIYSEFLAKYRKLKWASRVARVEEGKSTLKFLTDKRTGKKA